MIKQRTYTELSGASIAELSILLGFSILFEFKNYLPFH